MRTILIGDVHGCIDELHRLLAACAVTAEDRVVFVGDLVAKGPDSRSVIGVARERRAIGVRGNHDDRVLSFRHQRRPPERNPHAAVAASLRRDDWDYLESLPLWLELPELNLYVVHAGLAPGRSPSQHAPDELMNMRTIREDGRPSSRLEAGAPWASLWRGPRHVVFGHDARRGLQRYPFATGLDTGCVYGGALTALVVEDDVATARLVSIEAARAYAPASTPKRHAP